VISPAFIAHWRSGAPWATDPQVEDALIRSSALLELFSAPTLASAFAVRGGTALHNLVLPAPLRSSDDRDLVQVTPGPLGTVVTARRRRLDPLRGPSAFERSPIPPSVIDRFPSEIPPAPRLRFTIEINTREPVSVLGSQARPFHLASPWATGTAEITTSHPDELCATQIIRPTFRYDSLPLLPPNAASDPDGADERVRDAVMDRWPVA